MRHRREPSRHPSTDASSLAIYETPPEVTVEAAPPAEAAPQGGRANHVSGMHRSYEVPSTPVRPSGRYVSVGSKFIFALAGASVWLGVSIWISTPWVRGLATHITIVPALVIVSLLAFVPGFVVAFLVVGLAFDRQPALKSSAPTDPITVLVAARNEERAIADTVRSLAAQDYEGRLRVLLIDNGSTDETVRAARATALEVGLPLEVLSEPTPGKSHALNRGLAETSDDLVITVDADTLLQRSAIRLLVARMASSPPNVRAVAGAVLVRNSRSTFWSQLQTWDYFLGIASVKRMQGLFQNTLVAQGAFSLYHADAVRDVGGWPDAIGEDIVLTWKMMNNGARIFFEPLAVAFTSAPETFSLLARQRSRWARGMIEGLRTVPPWRHQHGYARVLTGFNLLIPLLDTAYVFAWLPGLILACFGDYWIVGPMTVAVLPVTLLV